MTVELFVFVVAGAACLAGAIGVILSENPVHAALSLVGTLFGIAVLFVAQEANFLAAVQVIVYAGAIVVLFLFVIMLLGVDRADQIEVDPAVPNVTQLARVLFTDYLYAFEITSILLIIAVVGAVVLARRTPKGSEVGS